MQQANGLDHSRDRPLDHVEIVHAFVSVEWVRDEADDTLGDLVDGLDVPDVVTIPQQLVPLLAGFTWGVRLERLLQEVHDQAGPHRDAPVFVPITIGGRFSVFRKTVSYWLVMR